MHSGHLGVVVLAAFSFALQLGCNDPDCPEGTRKIGISCVPLRVASDAGSPGAMGGAGETGLKGVDASLAGFDAGADKPSEAGPANDGASASRDDVRSLVPGPGTDAATGGPDGATVAHCYLDRDGDGSGSAAEPVDCQAHNADGGEVHAVTSAGDCDDMDPKRAPSLSDVCGDGIDNDCDGVVDDKSNNACGGPCMTALAHLPGQACDNGLKGACARSGVYACQGTETVMCNAGTGSPTTETCDGLDNDCDGTVDNGFFNECGGACTVFLMHKPGQPCTNGQLGACTKSGAYQCQGETTACNAPKMKPGRECNTADGIDNDCDGTVDNLKMGTPFDGCLLQSPAQPTEL